MLAALKSIDERLRGEIHGTAGGFEAAVAAKRQIVDNCLEELRSCKPMPVRAAQVQRHLENLKRKVAADAKAGDELAAKQTGLDTEKGELATRAARNKSDLAAAHVEVGKLAAIRAAGP